MIKLFVSILFTTSILTAGDSVSGLILDPSSRPVPGAIVECGSVRATSDIEGRFSLNSAGPCEATVAKPGFESLRVRLEPSREQRLTLRIAPLSNRVVVSATRTPTTVEESGVSVTVFTRQEIEARQYPPVFDLLRETPGLNVVASGGRGSLTGVFTRGAQRTGTLFLLDGIPLNEPGGEMNLAQLSPAGIERVEVVRGPESALFGAEAAAGIVQLFTTRGDPESNIPHGSVSYERGSYQTDRWIGNLNGGLGGRFDYSLTADQFHTVGMFQNSYDRNSTGVANLGFRLAGSTQLRAIYREFDSTAGNPNQVGLGIFDRDANGEDRDSALAVRVDDVRGASFVQRIAFTYHRLRDRFNDEFTDGPFDVAALVRKVNSPLPRVYLEGLVSPNFPLSQVPAGDTLVTNSVTLYAFPGLSVSDRTGVDYQGTWTHRGGAMVFGYEYENQGGIISATDVSRHNNGGFFHEQYSIGRRLFLTGGARIENSSIFGNKFAPRGSATFKLFGGHGAFSSTFLRASAGRGITEPSLIQNFANESFYVGNPKLKPEKVTSYDAGVVQEWFGSRLRAEATVFRNSFEDLIVFDSSTYPSSWNNIDSSWARGVELSATARPARMVQVSVAYTRLYTRITKTNSFDPLNGVGQELTRRPRNSGSAWLSITPRRWSFLIGGRFSGEQQDADFVFGASRNPGYGTMWLSGSYRMNKHVTPYVRIDNVLDARYSEALGYTALGRNAVGGARFTW